MKKRFLLLSTIVGIFFGLQSNVSLAQSDSSIHGTYRAVLQHDLDFYQYATVTLRTVNPGDGTLKISANVRIYFGNWDSNEFLTYDYPDCPMNILTRQISIKNDANDVSFIGNLKNGELNGEWFASAVGRVGKFQAIKTGTPPAPSGSQLVNTVTGHYKGLLTNNNPDSNLPERMTLSLVTTQETTPNGPELKITGNIRFYLGDFGSTEYVESRLNSVQFNFYSRYLTVKTENYGVTIKGVLSHDGKYSGDVFVDGLGKVGFVELEDVL